MTSVLILIICTLALILLSVIFLLRFRSYERRLSQMEMSVVRSVMEQNPSFIKSVVQTQEEFYRNGGLSPGEALVQSRRLHGLES